MSRRRKYPTELQVSKHRQAIGPWQQDTGGNALLLRRICQCKRRSLYITYRLKRGDPERVSVRHIVGLSLEDDYVPMLWETFRHASPATKWIDFKYQRGRSPWGLTKHVVLKQAHLSRLLRLYGHGKG